MASTKDEDKIDNRDNIDIIKTINIEESKNLFTKIIGSLINNPYVFGTIILLLMIAIYLFFNINNLSNINKQIDNIESNFSRISTGVSNNNSYSWINNIVSYIFSRENLLIIILISYFFLSAMFLFLYKRKEHLGIIKNEDILNQEEIKEKLIDPKNNFLTKIKYLLGSIGSFILLIVLFLSIYNKFDKLNYFLNLILGLSNLIIVLGGIYIIIKFFYNNTIKNILARDKDIDSNKTSKRLKFHEQLIKLVIEFIFFIPCIVLLLIDIIKDEIKNTTPIVWIILIIQIIIICLYFLIPLLLKNMYEHDGKTLLVGPVFIDKKRTVGTYQNVQKYDIYRQTVNQYNSSSNNNDNNSIIPFNIKVDLQSLDDKTQKFNFNYNYGISLFIYLNPQPINTSHAYVIDTPIFDYANKPKIVFNGLEQKLKFIVNDINNLKKVVYETNDIKYQKWMHIVVNYRSGIIDIFIDGTLRTTENNIQFFMKFSEIYVGSDKGIAGGIKNVMYFNEPLSLDKINFLHKFM